MYSLGLLDFCEGKSGRGGEHTDTSCSLSVKHIVNGKLFIETLYGNFDAFGRKLEK